ncbi:hypothetical protein LWI29_015680 [Acer saccharum]|uniref:FAD-binding FR-type domain-containing protein n=1 Tax=Acer saccharum TaxID=4024 RepID=A0AA39S397_ACESA|nr:hypothetical protein LWI29_015680 [Acer saccharum]
MGILLATTVYPYNIGDVHDHTTALLLSCLKWLLWTIMWLLFITWLAFIFCFPLSIVNVTIADFTTLTTPTFLGIEGPMFLIYSGPVLIIAFLSVPYLLISQKQQQQEIKKMSRRKCPSYHLSTFPLVVDGPLGVVSAAECVGILIFVSYFLWSVGLYAVAGEAVLAGLKSDILPFMFNIGGVSLGYIGIFCLAFLFLPIARGSILLRLMDIPFGHAARYHIWLAHLTVSLFLLHGICFMVEWAIEGVLLEEILTWTGKSGTSNLAGVINLSIILMMWVTSLGPVRQHYFEVFLYTHQLYILFIIFLALHIGSMYMSIVAAPILLFMLDRFLRFCQSKNNAHILSTTCFPQGILKLVLSKPKNLRYNALSFIFLRVGEVSRLQWHPFSVSSGSLDGDQTHLSVIIKALGGWTTKINEISSSICRAHQCPEEHQLPRITAFVEGPYGHEVPHHLMYKKLVLIAGGVGIAPFLAVLSDIFQLVSSGKPCLLQDILLVWAVKKSNELSLLSTIDIKLLVPPNLDILVYITRESEPPLMEEEGTVVDDKALINSFDHSPPVSNPSKMSGLVGSGDIMWCGIYLVSTTIGLIMLVCLLNVYYINPYDIPSGWYQGLLFVACMVASVIIFGGFVVALWHRWDVTQSSKQSNDDLLVTTTHDQNGLCPDIVASTKVKYGSRPVFKEIFEFITESWGNVDVGVIVCGPPTLESTVAGRCRSLNIWKQPHHPIFHFHSHTFSL